MNPSKMNVEETTNVECGGGHHAELASCSYIDGRALILLVLYFG